MGIGGTWSEWSEREGRRSVWEEKCMGGEVSGGREKGYTVGSHLSEHVGYPNAFSKATPTISRYFHQREAVQIADIECFRAHSTCCIAAEDTG